MGKSVYIAEKPSVAQEFAKALHVNFKRKDGYLEADEHIVTWCVGHLITMSYPEAYDANLKKWRFDTLPFIPEKFKYEVIPAVKKQFDIVKTILNRDDVETIYVCTDSGREGEYIYRLVRQEAHVTGKKERRVWIDSQTEEEILKGIKNAKDISEYDNLSAAAYLRAKEDYLMGINFSRVLTLKYGRNIANYLHEDRAVVSVGRVMTCVLGMVVRREREIRSFVKTPFFKVVGSASINDETFDAEWKVCEQSRYYGTPYLYKDNGFKEREKAEERVGILSDPLPAQGMGKQVEKVHIHQKNRRYIGRQKPDSVKLKINAAHLSQRSNIKETEPRQDQHGQKLFSRKSSFQLLSHKKGQKPGTDDQQQTFQKHREIPKE